jgi:hypothetical protein
MRFLYFDRIIEIESGKRIRAVKTFPLSEAYLKKHFSRAPLLHGEIVETDRRWSNCRAWVERDGERIASAERFVFPHFKEKYPEEVSNFYRDIGWIEPRWDWETP